MKAQGEVTTTLDGVGGQPHAPAALCSGKRPGTHRIGGRVGPRAGVDGCGKSRPHRDSIPAPSSPLASRYTDWAIPARNTITLRVAEFFFVI
jgi:hypothetical protein